jgi:serine/threonine protein kinase
VREVIRGHRYCAAHPELFDVPLPSWPQPGDEFDGLTVVRELGRGAFARVFLAVDPKTGDRPVALKLSATPSDEARTVGPIRHSNIAGIHRASRVDGFHAICMPFVGAATLQDVIGSVFRRGGSRRSGRTVLDVIDLTARLLPLAPPDAGGSPLRADLSYSEAFAAIALRLSDALAHLHRSGIAHGDLKPSNILLGPGGHPYLIDFNLATTPGDSLLRCGGTLPYMAPERLRVLLDEQPTPTDGRHADVYSFGVVMFEALTGRLPFGPADLPELSEVATDLLRRQTAGPPAVGPEVPPALARVVRDCLTPEPAARPTADELKAALLQFHGRKNRLPLVAFGATLALGLVLVGVMGWSAIQPSDSPAKSPEPSLPVVTVTAKPTTAQNFFDRGQKLLGEHDYQGARADFDKARTLREDGPTLAYLAHCMAVLDQPQTALEWFGEAIERYGYSAPWVHCNRAYCLTRVRPTTAEYELAVHEATIALKADPDLRPARYNRAFARYHLNREYLKTGRPADWTDCLADIEGVMKSGDFDADLYYEAALILTAGAAGDEARFARAVGYLADAVSLGRPPGSFARDIGLGPLKVRPDFNQLFLLSPGPARKKVPGSNLHFVSPPSK